TLIARRLVETGVRFLNVSWDGYSSKVPTNADPYWDTHYKNFIQLRRVNLPHVDLTFSALMEDLNDRGFLDETLVVMMSDFGRTPRVNAAAGRDHWTYCYSVLFAGAGIRGGHSLRSIRRPCGVCQRPPGEHRRHLRHNLSVPGHRSGDAGLRPLRPTAAGGERRQGDSGDTGVASLFQPKLAQARDGGYIVSTEVT